MRSCFKRFFAVILMLVMVLSLVPAKAEAAGKITTTPTGYDSADDVVYKTATLSGKEVRMNWGARGEDCVFLSTYAQSFYTSNYSFDVLSQLEGGSTQSNAYQSELYSALQTLMKSNHTYQNNYEYNKTALKYTDCVSNDPSQISSFYSGKMFSSTWDSGKTWNREHTWPNSKGLGGKDEDDVMMIRPTLSSENGSRGNKAYGLGSGCFDPGEGVRGDCARIFLYVYTRWGNTNGNGQYATWGSNGVIESLDTLLKWMAEDPVDTWEMARNDAVQSMTGTRNVFVDYPEYAWLLFGKDVPGNVTTPSHNTGVSGNPGSGNSGNTGDSGNTGNTGNSGSTTTPPADSNYEKVTSLKTGDKVVIVASAYNKALSMQKVGYYNVGVDVSGGFGSITNDEIFTVTRNSDGSYSFTSASGKVLALAAEYSSLNESGANKSWELSDAGNGKFYLRNTGRDIYLEWYASKDNWSNYKPDSLTDEYELTFYKKVESSSGGSSSGSNSGSNSGSTGNSGNTGNSGSTGNTGSIGNTGNTGNSGSNSGSGSGTGSISYADADFRKTTTLNTGDQVIIINPAHNVAFSMAKTGYYNIGVDVSGGFQAITDTEVLTVTKNADGSYSFATADGKKLALAAEYSSLNKTGENAAWTLIAADNGKFYLQNVGRGNYLEWYAEKQNWSSYNTQELGDLFAVEFHKIAQPGSTDGGNTDATEPPVEPTEPETQAPTQEPTQEPTDLPNASEPAPTDPVGGEEKKGNGWIWIVLSVVLVLGVAGAYVYIAVIRPKQAAAAPVAEAEEAEAPAEEAEAPAEETPEEN